MHTSPAKLGSIQKPLRGMPDKSSHKCIGDEVDGRVRKQRADERWQDQLTRELERDELWQKKAEAATDGETREAEQKSGRRAQKGGEGPAEEGDSLRRDGLDSDGCRAGAQDKMAEDMFSSVDLESPPRRPQIFLLPRPYSQQMG